MSNTFLTPQVVAREGLMILVSNLVAANLVYRDMEQEWTGAKIGDTVSIRKPATFVANEFSASNNVVVQNITEGNVPLQLEKHYDVTVNVTSRDWTLSVDAFSERVVRPVMVAIAEAIDKYVFSKYTQFPYFIGTAGAPPSDLPSLAAIDQRMNELRIPVGGRFSLVNPKAKATMLGIPSVVQAYARGDDGTALKEASMGRVMGLDWYMAQNVTNHTPGTATADACTFGANQNQGDTSISINCTGTHTLVPGDTFTISGVYDAFGRAAQFAIGGPASTAAGAPPVVYTATAGVLTSIPIYPALPQAVASGTAMVFNGAHAANLAMHPHALALAIVPLELPRGAANAAYMSDGGVGIRVVYGYNTSTKTDTISFDVLCGAKVIQPELGVRILG